MSAKDEFNQILKNRAAWELNLGAPTAAQWAEWAMNILARHDVNRLAVATGAAALLTFAWNRFREQREHEMDSDRGSAAWLPDVYPWLAPLNTLLDPDRPALTDADVEEKLMTFVTSATRLLDEQQASAGAKDPVLQAGIIASAGVPTYGLAAYAHPAWPDVSLLWSQAEPLVPLLKAMGRQTGDKTWAEWFAAKFDVVKSSIPALAEMGAWAGLGKIINHLLDVGLIPVLGTNVITFGSSLLTPVKALVDFPVFMEKQAILYRLHEYGSKELRLPATNPVMKAITSAIDSVDWAAVRIAFQVTPASLLISVYSGVKFLTLTAKPSAGRYYDDAKALIDAADTIRTGRTHENTLALMAIMHLAGKYDSYITIMTERREDAYAALSSKMDV